MSEETVNNPVATMRDAMETHLPADVVNNAGGLILVDNSARRTITDWTSNARIEKREAEAAAPVRRKGTARLATLQSLTDWANRYKGDHSALFLDIARPSNASVTSASGTVTTMRSQRDSGIAAEVTTRTVSADTTGHVRLVAVANYHADGKPEEGEETTARHCDHRGVYDFPVSEAWKRWTDAAGEPMDVAAFGRFLEDNARDLLDPTPYIASGGDLTDSQNWEKNAVEIATRLKGDFATVSTMIDLGRQFGVVVDEKVAVKVDRQSGRANMTIREDHSDEDGNELRLPRLFLISIPVFDRGDLYPLVCTFSYTARGPKLSFDLYDATAAFDDAIEEVATKANEETDLPLFYGTPES